MSDYRRFIAYLYEYINNQKGPNCGFVRVEVQNGYCRMDFHIKGVALPEHPLSVYGFLRREQKLYGILLGELTPGRSNITGKLFTRTDVLSKTRYSLNDLGGLLITGKDARVLATQWDDIPILPWTFTPSLPETAKKPNAILSRDPIQTPADSQIAAPIEAPSEAPTEIPIKTPVEIPVEDSFETPVEDPIETPVEAPVVTPIMTPVTETSAVPSTEETSPKIPEELHIASVEQTENPNPSVFYPFSDDELINCIRLEPKDLVKLRAEGFLVNDNPFLSHGFHNYRHLLLAQSSRQGKHILGVPGIYNVNEQFMASLFGFYRFKQAKRPPELSQREQFGYWYKELPSTR
ncbi:MAG: DUF6128 domain-containing protein [Fusicatenibacter sp.]|nr:DUF6128 domain-containing protein [Lachnospiraceae bacterium]MDY2937072.1 DUF6128 domain-containing protein [Fusicatenibacter sp.]